MSVLDITVLQGKTPEHWRAMAEELKECWWVKLRQIMTTQVQGFQVIGMETIG